MPDDTDVGAGVFRELAVVIPYFRGEQFLEKCLHSLTTGTLLPARIYIADNDPDGLDLSLHYLSNPTIEVIRTNPGIGFGRAANIGVYRAMEEGYDFYLVLNQDTVLNKDCLEQFRRNISETTSDRFLIAAMVFEYDENRISTHYTQTILSTLEDYSEDEKSGILKGLYPLHRMFAMGMLTCRSLVKEFGLFDPVFYMYGEDDDLSKRVLQGGGAMFQSTTAIVHHYHSLEQSTGEHLSRIRTQQFISRMRLRIRYDGKSKWWCIRRCYYLALKRMLLPARVPLPSRDYLRARKNLLNDWDRIISADPESTKSRILSTIKSDLDV